jgi:hypothetical protein
MSSTETSAKEAKPGGKSSASQFNSWAVVIPVVLLAWVVIHVAQAHGDVNKAQLCTFKTLRDFAESNDANGLVQISDNCGGSRVAGEARHILWDWAKADWKRAAARNTASSYREFCSVWGRYELARRYYDCASALRNGRTSALYRNGRRRLYRRPASAGEYVAQVFSGATRDSAEAYRNALKRRHRNLLAGLTVVVADTGPRGYGGEHKVLIGPLANKRDADSLCSELKSRHVDCFSKAAAVAPD